MVDILVVTCDIERSCTKKEYYTLLLCFNVSSLPWYDFQYGVLLFGYHWHRRPSNVTQYNSSSISWQRTYWPIWMRSLRTYSINLIWMIDVNSFKVKTWLVATTVNKYITRQKQLFSRCKIYNNRRIDFVWITNTSS